MTFSDLQRHSPIASFSNAVFTAQSYASAVCPSVRLSVQHKLVLYQNG